MTLAICRQQQSWLELGNHIEANDCLEQMPPELRAHREVLELRCRIYAAAKKWDECIVLAETLTDASRSLRFSISHVIESRPFTCSRSNA